MKQFLRLVLSLFGFALAVIPVTAAKVISSHTYAWSSNVGYINFANVIVNDFGLSGYAWSEKSGFIHLDPARGGVFNDGRGNLTGSAWGGQLGWIDFRGVSINSLGKFSGVATGEIVGTVTFDCPNFCDVQTDWRPISVVTQPPTTPDAPVIEGVVDHPPTDVITAAQPPGVVPQTTDTTAPITSGESTGKAPLFDVSSEPAESKKQNTVPFIVVSTILEIATIVLVLFVGRKIWWYSRRRIHIKQKAPTSQSTEVLRKTNNRHTHVRK